ncbi:MAG: hydrogenase maturation protease [Peptococcaceae bacterium]|nr:hydrogenase maturation protease [Peptococcaceae bacterium]
MTKIAVIGLGNPLLKDDGIGPRVIRELQKSDLPPWVKAVEAGGSFYYYWDLLLNCRYVIAVDSMLGGGLPGSVYLVTPEQIAGSEPVPGLRHEVHFLDVLKMVSFYGARPQVTIIGVEPKEITYSTELSMEIAEKIPAITGIVRQLCQSFNPSPMAIINKTVVR